MAKPQAQRRGPAEPLGAPAKSVTDGLKAGDKVWMADRSNGRVTEHLATVQVVRPATLVLLVTDNGTQNRLDDVGPWTADSIIGWWRT